jgi:hypothetical protein
MTRADPDPDAEKKGHFGLAVSTLDHPYEK